MNAKHIIVIALSIAGVLLSACGSGSGNNAMLNMVDTSGTPAPRSEQTQPPTETPDLAPEENQQIAPRIVQVEVTRVVPATVIVQHIQRVEVPVEVTRQVIDVQTQYIVVTPEVIVDESVQPCPVRYWRNGRCVATDAQIDAFANEVQP